MPPCPNCGRKFSGEDRLEIHLRSCTPGEKYYFVQKIVFEISCRECSQNSSEEQIAGEFFANFFERSSENFSQTLQEHRMSK